MSSSLFVRMDTPYPHPNDVLYGRGAFANNHPGNKKYQRWIRECLQLYLTASNLSKRGICQQVVNKVLSQDPPGRFLIWDNEWKIVSSKEMILSKVGQAFRDAHKLMDNRNRGEDEDNMYTISTMNNNNNHIDPHQRSYYYPKVDVSPANVMRYQINNIPPFSTTTQCAHDDDLGPAISRLYPNTTAVTTNTTAGWQAQQTAGTSTEKMMTPYPSASTSNSKFALDGTTTLWKEFPDYGWFQGTVTRYNQFTGLYLVSYPDGDSEELDEYQIQDLLRNNPPDPNNNNNNNNDSSNSNNKRSTPTGASLQEGDVITQEVIGQKEEKEATTTSQEGLLDKINNNGSGRSIDEPLLLLSDDGEDDDDDDDDESGHKDTTQAAVGETTVAATSNQEGGIIKSSGAAPPPITTTRPSHEPPKNFPAQTTFTNNNNNSDPQQGGGGDSSTPTTRSSFDEPQPEQTESNNNSNQQFNGGAISTDATSELEQQQQQAQEASSDNNNEDGSGDAVGSSVATTKACQEQPQQKRQRLDHQGNHHQPSAGMMAQADIITPQHSKSQQQQQSGGGSKYAHLLFSQEKSDVTINCQDVHQSSSPIANTFSLTTRPCCGISIQIPAHKKVLAESSSVLKALWLADPTSNTLSFPSYPAPVVKEVLIHIYTNQTIDPTILRSYLPSFLEFTKLFGFEDLHMYAGRQAYNLLNLNNLEKVLRASLRNSDGTSSMMKDVCFAFIQNHAEEVLTSPRMTRLTTEDPRLWRDIVQAVLAPKREFAALLCQK